jgi:septal ring factor EnvC (AmiA/AmiB activator)
MLAPARARLRSALAAPLAAALATGLLVCAAAAQQPDVDAGIGPAAQIAELERQIARDRTTLRELIGQRDKGRADIASDPRLREIAERLPRLQRELEALRREPAP